MTHCAVIAEKLLPDTLSSLRSGRDKAMASSPLVLVVEDEKDLADLGGWTPRPAPVL